ncbi:DUF3775 domain-containing protein [Hyphomicrobium sp.]|uniref:DUF3775 domain-containing protein n=1 Tax=Hyphomicrobium sp. TaxID=82 RepID=UPI002FDD9607
METNANTPSTELSISPDYISRLIVKARGVQSREGLVDPDAGSNPTDDRMVDALQEGPGDLSRAEIVQEIIGLNPDQQNELVALMWLGRGDFEPAEWQTGVQTAAERRERPTASYLLSQPLVADYWAEGLERLGFGVPMLDPDSDDVELRRT